MLPVMAAGEGFEHPEKSANPLQCNGYPQLLANLLAFCTLAAILTISPQILEPVYSNGLHQSITVDHGCSFHNILNL